MNDSSKKISLIGIAGCSGGGKTWLANKLFEKIGSKKAQVINVDSYYRSRSDIPYEERCSLNYDHPDSLELDLLARHLDDLRSGRPAEVPIYDFSIHNRLPQSQRVDPSRYLIVEGILTFHLPELRELFDLKIFVDTPLELCLERRIERDVRERGRTEESVILQWNQTVKPMYEQFCAPTVSYADSVVQGEASGDLEFEALLTKILNSE